MTVWMMWATLVTGLLGVAGVAVEHLLRVHGRQTRWAWMGALGTASALQMWSWIRPRHGMEPLVSTGLGGIPTSVTDVPQSPIITVASVLSGADDVLTAAWLVGTVALAIALAAGLWRLKRRVNRWPRARVEGEDVWLSDGFGPAVVGFWAPRIVLPRWTLALSSERLRLACLHETEHRLARDTILLLTAAIAVIVTPWNVAIWWVASRLRQAVELDCDRRVLRAGASRSAYGALLIDLSTDPFVSRLPVAGLSKPVALLERRLRMLTTNVNGAGPVRSTFLFAAVAALAIVACEVPAPSAIQDSENPDDAAVTSADRSLLGQLRTGVEDRSVTVEGEPLVVVDGVVLEGMALDDLDELDPNSIERIEVLKGPAATGLYGPRGAGGVIQIFTRSASGADLEQAPAPVARRGGNIRRRGAAGDPKVYVDGQLIETRAASGSDVEQAPAPVARRGSNIRIRGAAGDPKIYIDGQLIEGSLDQIEPDRVERIEVVKTTGEEAIYIYLKPT